MTAFLLPSLLLGSVLTVLLSMRLLVGIASSRAVLKREALGQGNGLPHQLTPQVLGFTKALWLGSMVGAIALLSLPLSAQAGAIDPYIARYFDAAEPVTLPLNSKGDTRAFSSAEFSTGKKLFEENCINCHVGGVTLPDPTVSLSLEALKGATPPRDTIASLVAFMRQPMVYDGSEETIWCRQVSKNWMTDAELETLSAFLLRATEKAPAWASNDLFR